MTMTWSLRKEGLNDEIRRDILEWRTNDVLTSVRMDCAIVVIL